MSDTGSRVQPGRPERSRRNDASDFWPEDVDKPRSGRRGLLLGGAVGVVVLVAVVIIAYAMMGGKGSGSAKGAGSTTSNPPTVYVPTSATAGTKKLDARTTDSRALNEGEVFDNTTTTVSHGTYKFSLVAKEINSDCQATTWGATLQADLKKYECTQVVRGAYLSSDKQHSGQFIALNLAGLDGSEAIVRDLTPTAGSGFVRPLPGPGIKSYGAGFSAAYPQIFGHYVVISWVQRNGGARPASMNELLDASLAIESADGFVWERLVLAGG